MPPWGNRSISVSSRSAAWGTARRSDGRESDWRQSPTARSPATDRDKTDGVPLFVEELTKTVLESVGSEDTESVAPTAFAFRHLAGFADGSAGSLGHAKEIAQLGATIGREFSYELLQAVSRLDEETLQQGLKQLVEAELVYQRGLAAAGPLSVQACPDSGYRLSIVAEEQAPTVSSADCPGVNGPFPETVRNPTGTASSPLHRSQPQGASHSLLAKSWTASEPTLGQCGSNQLTSPRGWSCSRPCRTLPSAPSKNSRCKLLWVAVMLPKAMRPRKWKKPTLGRGSCAGRWGDASALPGVVWSVAVLY